MEIGVWITIMWIDMWMKHLNVACELAFECSMWISMWCNMWISMWISMWMKHVNVACELAYNVLMLTCHWICEQACFEAQMWISHEKGNTIRIQHLGPESGPRQCWNMPTYSAPGPGVRTQTILKYAYVFSTRAQNPDPDNVEICLRIQHPGPESGPRQYWNMPMYSAPGPGVRTRTILKPVALKNALKNENVCAQEWVIGGNLSARFWVFDFKTLKIFRPVYLHQQKTLQV